MGTAPPLAKNLRRPCTGSQYLLPVYFPIQIWTICETCDHDQEIQLFWSTFNRTSNSIYAIQNIYVRDSYGLSLIKIILEKIQCITRRRKCQVFIQAVKHCPPEVQQVQSAIINGKKIVIYMLEMKLHTLFSTFPYKIVNHLLYVLY